MDGDISFVELATKTGLDEPRLRRLLRYSMMTNLFQEPRIGYVAHTSLSALLVTDRATQDYIGHAAEISYPLNAKFVDAVEKWGNDGEQNHTALNIAHNTELPFYPYMMTHKDPSVTARFHGLMEGLDNSEGHSVKHTINGYDWAAIGNGKVVDVRPYTVLAPMTCTD
jgi:6-hydroxytryprostatin B O-methyltransferase